MHPIVDFVSGQPDAKTTPAALAPEPMAVRGFLLSRRAATLPAPGKSWWARAAVEGGSGTLFATNLTTREVAEWPAAMFPGAELAEYVDDAAGVYRCAATVDGRLEAVLFAGPAERSAPATASRTFSLRRGGKPTVTGA